MPSNINYEDIDENFPKAGVDNPTQGFRDNFSTIKNSLFDAKEEIENLQDTTAKITANNNFNGNQIIQAKLVNCSEDAFLKTTPSNSDQIIDYISGTYQEFKVDKNSDFVLQGWPSSDNYAKIRVAIYSTTTSEHVIKFRTATGTMSYDQETTFLELGNNNSQLIKNGMSETHLVGQKIKTFEFWTRSGGTLVFARYLGEYDQTSPNQGTGNFSVQDLTALNNVTVTNNLSVGNDTEVDGDLDVQGDTNLKNVTVDGDLTVIGNFNVPIPTGLSVSSLTAIGDIDITNPADGDTLTFNASRQNWSNSKDVIEYTVSIGQTGAGNQNVFFFNGFALQTSTNLQNGFRLARGKKYRFKLDNSTNALGPLRFSTTPDTVVPDTVTPYSGPQGKPQEVFTFGTAGQTGSYVEINVTDYTPSPLYIYGLEVGLDTSLIGAAYPIQIGDGAVKVTNKVYNVLGSQRIIVDTTAGPITIKLPITPEVGTLIVIADSGNAATNNITIDRNGKTIDGLAANRVLTTNYANIEMIFDGSNWTTTDNTKDGISIKNTAQSTNTTTGALTVAGGLGVAKNLNVGENLDVNGDADFAGKIIYSGLAKQPNTTIIPLTTTTTWFETAGPASATLDIGAEGQIKFLSMRSYNGNMEVLVTSAGWNVGSGRIIIDAQGKGCMLQFISGKWMCIGNNGCGFVSDTSQVLQTSVSISAIEVDANSGFTTQTPIVASGGVGSYTYSITPLLPTGLILNASNGSISGNPTVARSLTTYIVTVTDEAGQTSAGSFNLKVNPQNFTNTRAFASVTFEKNVAISPFNPFTPINGVNPITYSIQPLPPTGLVFNTSTGILSGTATVASTSTFYTVTMVDSWEVPRTTIGTFTITVT